MLFNSYEFLFLFLPVVYAGFWLIGRRSGTLAAAWLTLASLFFYGYWSIQAAPILLASICINFAFFRLILTAGDSEGSGQRRERLCGKRALLVCALTFDLALLGYFKYAGFFVDSANGLGTLLGMPPLDGLDVVLPIGISFFTFTQIAYLVDVYRGEARERSFLHYSLFVTYFPHLIAGPVLHHKQMMPQFERSATYRFNVDNLTIGLLIFSFGLFKKVVIADGLAPYADAVFGAAEAGTVPMAFEAWSGALAYTFQLYFDFSSYCDMAIGISKLFNIDLPINFNSPYKATSIIEFWRRWHITLSNFLRDYLYIPLGGNKHGRVARYRNLMVTMLLGGLWHGAGWTFVLWGGLHGLYLVINHLWRERTGGLKKWLPSQLAAATGFALTFVAVVVGWVAFRSNSLPGAANLYQGMMNLASTGLPALDHSWDRALLHAAFPITQEAGLSIGRLLGLLLACGLIAFATPNLYEVFRPFEVAERRAAFRRWAYVAGIALVIGLGMIRPESPFLYFQF